MIARQEPGRDILGAGKEGSPVSQTVCKCHGLSRDDALAMLETASLSELRQTTGAGSSCGGCVPLLGEISGRSRLSPARCIARLQVDDSHVLLTLRGPPFDPPGPADTVVVEVTPGDGRILHRSYTVVSSRPDTGDVEILLRRDPNGLVSPMLADSTVTGLPALRISTPTTSPAAGLGGLPDGGVFLAAGVGITPALSWITWALERNQDGGMVDVFWWRRGAADSPLPEFIRGRITANKRVRLHECDTSLYGRPDRETLSALLESRTSGLVHICGPWGFMERAVAACGEVNLPESRRVLESFVSAPGQGLDAGCDPRHSAAFDPWTDPVEAPGFRLAAAATHTELRREADAFLRQYYAEEGGRIPFPARRQEIMEEIDKTGCYTQTSSELAFGARLAWRNSARCIGRFFWQSLHVRDMRHLRAATPAALADRVFAEVLTHIETGTNDGDLRAVISVFPPNAGIRILNPQLILYAGYRQPDGSITGDPKNIALTELATSLGWEAPGTPFDVLPLMIRVGDAPVKLYTIPCDKILEVHLRHPEASRVADLGLRWFALPAVADMALDCGGIVYSAAPSNGFYMGTEIGSFNLADPHRYNQTEAVARACGIMADDEMNPLWRDQATVEINRAVLHSFREDGVRIMDHHALSQWFERFRREETNAGRPVYGHWPWIVPPLSANLSNIWHDKSLRKVVLKPNYFYQDRVGALEAARGM